MFTLAEPHGNDALVSEDRRVSYDELLACAWRLAPELEALPGDQIVVFGTNGIDWIIVAYAAWAARKVLVPVDAMATAEDLEYVIADCRPSIVFCSTETQERAAAAVERVDGTCDASPELRPIEGCSDGPVLNELARPITAEDEQAIACLVYTSGTTGSPKGVMLSYQNLRANVDAVEEAGFYSPDDRVLLLLPCHHVLPLVGNILAPLATGGTVVIAPSLARDDIVRTLNEQRITMIIGVPRFYELLGQSLNERIQSSLIARSLFRLAESRKSEAFSKKVFAKVHAGFGGHIRHMICGGAALDSKTARLFQVLGFKLCEGYGMSECAPMISFPRPSWIKPGFCGQAIPNSDIEIRDGEIVVRGPQVMPGYFGRPKETADVIRDGWLHTGDLGEFDDDGFLRITGRRKEILILPSGKNVNPALSEGMLGEGGDVEEVGVFLDGGVLHALVVLAGGALPQGESDPESWVWSRIVAPYNERVAPYRQISRLTLCPEPLARTRLGKLQRYKLADCAARARAARDDSVGVALEAAPGVQEVEAATLEYLARVCGQPAHPTHRLGADLGLDSLGRLELSEFLASRFGVEVPETELDDRARVREISERVERERKQGGHHVQASPKDASVPLELPVTSTLHGVILRAFRVFVGVFWTLDITGRENLPTGPAVFAPNHQSAADGLLLTAALKTAQAREIFFLGKNDHLHAGWREQLARRCRVIILDRSAGVGDSLRALAKALSSGHPVAVFPEGTRTRTGELGDFKESYARVAVELGVPVVPVAIGGAFEVMPPGASLPRPFRRIHIRFLPPVDAAGADPKETNQRVRAAIDKELGAEVHPVLPGETS